MQQHYLLLAANKPIHFRIVSSYPKLKRLLKNYYVHP